MPNMNATNENEHLGEMEDVRRQEDEEMRKDDAYEDVVAQSLSEKDLF